ATSRRDSASTTPAARGAAPVAIATSAVRCRAAWRTRRPPIWCSLRRRPRPLPSPPPLPPAQLEFKGSLTAGQAARAIEAGVRAGWPQAEVTVLPLADGGPGTAAAAVGARGRPGA